jgi:hypothetical protein
MLLCGNSEGFSLEENLIWFRTNCVGKRRRVRTVFLVGKPEEREHLEGLSVNGRIILKCILSKWDEGEWTGLRWLSSLNCCVLKILYECLMMMMMIQCESKLVEVQGGAETIRRFKFSAMPTSLKVAQ